jgi:hypothetical protein
VQQEIYWVQCDLLVAAKPRSWSPPEPRFARPILRFQGFPASILHFSLHFWMTEVEAKAIPQSTSRPSSVWNTQAGA